MAVPWSEWPSFLYRQLLLRPTFPTHPFTGLTIIITGSNTGLGLSAAQHFARLGAAHIILAVRDLSKGEAAAESISQSLPKKKKNVSSPSSSTTISVWHLDLSSYQSVKDFVARASHELNRVDVFCANAGIATGVWKIQEQDESTITVNVVSTFLLALLMLPQMKQTATRFNTRPVLTVTTSEAHAFCSFPEKSAQHIFRTLSDPSSSSLQERYFLSKLLQIYLVRSLASHTTASYPVTINSVNPGFCHSELGREAGWQLYIMGLFLARTSEVGARTIVGAAAMGMGEGRRENMHGAYISDGEVVEPDRTLVTSEEGRRVQERVWGEMVEKMEAIMPGIMERI